MAIIGRRSFLKRAASAAVALLPPSPSARRVSRPRAELSLANESIEAAWAVADGRLRALRVEDRLGGRTLAVPGDVFTLTLADGTLLPSSELKVEGVSQLTQLAGDPRVSRLAERLGGREVAVRLIDPRGRLRATWRAVLRDGSRYVRQEVTLEAVGGELPVRELRLVDLELAGAAVAGSVRGSPVIAGNLFAGFEHPLATSSVSGTRVVCALQRELPLRPGTAPVYSSVIGTTAPGELRRGFQEYLERERAHPYRPFLHYNSWYDIGYFSKYDEPAALAVIEAFGTELQQRRGVPLDGFLFDDGWDDPRTLWRFHPGFPRGFAAVRAAAARYGAAPGVWLSPWGGYGRPRDERLAYGRAQGFETNEGGFALSGPRYYARFRETCLDMIRTYGVRQFKFDGTGNVAHAIPGSAFDSDFDAMIALIGELRAAQPDLFVNLTTGTYPSPFFLRYADTIWRGGEDHDFTGVGSDRQRWITYRDADTYAGIVRRGPLFPLNALMLHGLIYARHARNLATDPQGDFTAEIRAYFGTGTGLQEMYVSPALLTTGNWDALAEAAGWARRNAGTLADTHWVGGDPAALQPYGHAAWTPAKGILALRNPKDAPQVMELDLAAAFELPPQAPRRYWLKSPWVEDQGTPPIALHAGEPHRFELGPFEVVVLETV